MSAINIENLTKHYRIASSRKSENFRELLTNKWNRLIHPRSKNGYETFAALQDVNFQIKEGEVVGIVGRNGAGKSTLLKIISRITPPTSGRITFHGRVSSLLEVGTGFHPELTGRENVYLNGSILGMKKREITAKFDNIISFADIDKFVDTPVKRYSSGMYVRLAFAVAANLDADVLLIDEVLSVGDAIFQKKCVGKMGEMVKSGRTIIFVSHNLPTVKHLCSRALLLSNGKLVKDGPTAEVLTEYLRDLGGEDASRRWNAPESAPGNERFRLRAINVLSGKNSARHVNIDEETVIEVEYWNFDGKIQNACVNAVLHDETGTIVLSTANTSAANAVEDSWNGKTQPMGVYRSTCRIPANFLNEGVYYVSVNIITLGPLEIHASLEQSVSFQVHDTGVMREPGGGSAWPGVVRVRLPWKTERLSDLEPHIRTGG